MHSESASMLPDMIDIEEMDNQKRGKTIIDSRKQDPRIFRNDSEGNIIMDDGKKIKGKNSKSS